MDILGSIGQLYMFVLLALLFLGSGLAVWAIISNISKNKAKTAEKINKLSEKIKNNNINGGINMKSNGFIKLAVFSLVGIIISAAILTALPNNNINNMNMQGTSNGMFMNAQGNVNMQSNMNGTSMQGMTNTNMQSNMNSQYNNSNSIQQQLYNMQMQLNQLQNQLNSGMQSQGNMNNMNNNNNNNSNMNNNNSSNMNNSNSNSNSNSSGSSMSMPMM